MTPLLTDAASISWTDTTWGKVVLAAALVVLVNAVVFVPRRLIRMRKRRRQEVIPKVVGLVLSELDENFFQLQVSPATSTFADSGVRLAVAAQIPGESGRHVVTEPTPVPQNTLVIPKEVAPPGSILWVNWVVGDRVGPSGSVRVPEDPAML
jgi:hypothetical protein